MSDSAGGASANLKMALAYAVRGLAVFPCWPRSKFPACPHGHLDATTDETTLTQWWSATPEANIGMACAPSGVVVLDTDPRHGGDQTLAALEGELGKLPETVEAKSGGTDGGQHFMFRAPKGQLVGKLGDGLDVKHNGYVLLAPSVHPSGGVYRWERSPLEHEPADLPPSWAARMIKPTPPARGERPRRASSTTDCTPYGRAAVDAELDRVRTAPVGERNNALNTAAHSLAQLHAGGEAFDAREELIAAAMTAGLPENEARRTIDSGWRAGLARPRAPLRPPRTSKAERTGASANSGGGEQSAQQVVGGKNLAPPNGQQPARAYSLTETGRPS